MGDGCKIAVFDLDGTLYAGATFRKYILWGFRMLWNKGKRNEALLLMRRFLMSKLGIVSHIRMKYDNCRLLDKEISDKEIEEFVDSLMSGVAQPVKRMKDDLSNRGYHTVLSTASPSRYCMPLARRLGFDSCHATGMTDSFEEFVENRGLRKVKRLHELENKYGGSVNVVVTDHHDDLPLLQYNRSGSNYLVSPSSKTQMIVKMAGLPFTPLA